MHPFATCLSHTFVHRFIPCADLKKGHVEEAGDEASAEEEGLDGFVFIIIGQSHKSHYL